MAKDKEKDLELNETDAADVKGGQARPGSTRPGSKRPEATRPGMTKKIKKSL